MYEVYFFFKIKSSFNIFIQVRAISVKKNSGDM
jgi:hypothetical protein